MIAVIQRVRKAHVAINERIIAAIDQGILALVAVEKSDTTVQLQQLTQKIIDYRIFTDEAGRMNHSLTDIQGGLLIVPQFTLAADTRSGLRPGFSAAAPPTMAKQLFSQLCDYANQQYAHVAQGVFGADMQIELINDGPVTFYLQQSNEAQ